MSPTTVVSVENTHNFGGGLIWDEDELLGVLKAANELGLAKHLDGARLWHAAVATGKSEAELAQGFDTVAVCLSKGLGCPIGSLVAGSEEVVHKVHRVRNILGGSMRQVGIIAAAGLYAIDNHRDRLAEDHDNATLLAEGFNGLPGLTVNLENVHTNLIMVDVGEEIPGGAPGIAEAAAARGIMFTPLGPERFRMVTHLDVNREQCTQAIEVVSDILSAN